MNADDQHRHDHDDRAGDGYEALQRAVKIHFDRATAEVGPDERGPTARVLVRVGPDLAEVLFDAFLAAIPEEGGARRHYTCSACRAFVRRYGGLATVDSAGAHRSAVWPTDDELAAAGVPAASPLTAAVRAVRRLVERAPSRDLQPYVSGDEVWGTPETTGPDWGDPTWRHLHVRPHSRLVHRASAGGRTANQRAADLREDAAMLRRGLAEYPVEVVSAAHRALADGTLYRGDRFVDWAKWVVDLQAELAHLCGYPERDAVTLRAAALAPAGWCRVRSGMLGTLLEDLAAGRPADEVKRAWAAKMDPSAYQRVQVAPRAGNVAQAERTFAEMGLAPALERRYARLDEVAAYAAWTRGAAKSSSFEAGQTEGTSGQRAEDRRTETVFGHLLGGEGQRRSVAAPGEPSATMTWDKFQRSVLHDAVRLEVKVPTSDERFAALVTAVHPDAPPILQWDCAVAAQDGCPHRNTFSWYYHGGVDAEMRRRVTEAGGKYDDVDVRATLLWNDRSDLDLHVHGPEGEVFFGRKRIGAGWLDVDMNVSGETTTPVENVRWPKGTAPRGHYKVVVHNYTPRTDLSPFELELEVAGQTFRYAGVAPGRHAPMAVCYFSYLGGPLQAAPRVGMGVKSATSAASGAQGTRPNAWGLVPGEWTDVTAVVPSPNTWANLPSPHGRHVFLTLVGCRDQAKGRGRGLFTEHLRAELRPVRATVEAHVARQEVQGADDASAPLAALACGLGFTDQSPLDVVVRATRRDGTVTCVKLDRWD